MKASGKLDNIVAVSILFVSIFSFATSVNASANATTSIGRGVNGTVNLSVDEAGSAGNNYTVTVVHPSVSTEATASIGTGTNGTVNIVVDEAGAAGNDYTVTVKSPDPVCASATVGSGINGTVTINAKCGSDPSEANGFFIGVSIAETPNAPLAWGVNCCNYYIILGTDGNGDPDPTKNTATLVAALINESILHFGSNIQVATASGDGSASLSEVEPTSFSGGALHPADVDLSVDLDGTDITVTLGTDGDGNLDDTKNTATLVAAAINSAVPDVTATATGDGGATVQSAGLSGLEAYWTFDNGDIDGVTASDASGNNNDGTLTNGPVSGGTGQIKQSVSFDGTNDYIDVADSVSLSFTGNFTLSAWFRTNTTSQQAIIEKYDPGPHGGYALRLEANKVVAYTLGDSSFEKLTGGTTASTGDWHLATAVYNGSTLKVFLDGVLDGSMSDTVSPGDGIGSLRIGARGDDAGTTFSGSLDDVRVYDRALSADEILHLYYFPGYTNNFSGGTEGAGSDDPLSVTEDGTDISIYLGLDSDGNLDDTKNTATLVAAAINDAVSDVTATASGDGSAPIYDKVLTGLMGYWNFDEGSGTEVGDSSANDNVGTVFGNPSWVAGKIGGALSFDGDHDSVDVPDNSSLDVGTDELTISAWVYPRTCQGDQEILKHDGAYLFRWHDSSCNLSSIIWTTDSSQHTLNINNPLSPDTWHHIVSVYDGSVMKIYIDDVLQSPTSNLTGNILNSSQHLLLGSHEDHVSEDLDGIIDDVRVYDRALSDDEIGSLYDLPDYTNNFSGGGDPDISLSTSSLSITEGEADSYTVVLGLEPTDNVVVTLTAPIPETGSGITLDPEVLTFTPENWDTPQEITVTTVDDDAEDGNRSVTISAAVDSNDTEYDGFLVSDVNVDITEDDHISATLTVNSLLDDGDGNCTVEYCTLRDAVNNSQDGDTVEFSPSLTSGGPATITITEGSFETIDHSLTITGPGADILTLDFDGNSGGFYHTDGDFIISNLTITNGDYPIEESSNGTLTLTDMIFSDNNLDDYEVLYIDSSSLVTITNSTFVNNSADSYGGAIYDDGGDLTITDSTFENNTSVYTGGIAFYGNDLTISNSTFNNNITGTNEYGGAIDFEGDNLNISNSTFYQNSNPGGGYGGAVYIYGDTATITNSTFVENDGSYGGAVYVSSGVTDIINSTFHNNTADSAGSVIYNYSGEVSVVNSIFSSSTGNNCSGSTITSLGHNIDSGDSCVFNQTGDLVNPSGLTKLHDFNGDNGSYPYWNALLSSGGKFYGTTYAGGADDYGVIFKYDPANIGNEYSVLHEFDGDDGGNPYSTLVESGGKFYGMTYAGGADNYGVIFEYDPASIGTEYSVLHEFDGDDGGNPYNSLTVLGGKFYGMTSAGGADNYGVIFEYDPANTGSEYSVLHDFNGDTGSSPYGALTEIGGKFYGMTQNGGADDDGVMFEYDPASIGTEYSVLHEFDTTTGDYPQGSLTVSSGKLYGMTYRGGVDDYGVIFKYDPAAIGSEYSVLHEFQGNNDGSYPYGSLTMFNGKFYGTLYYGGDNSYGLIFEYDPVGDAYKVVHRFNNINGANPYGNDLVVNGGKFYGMTYNGGTNDSGIIYSFDPNIDLVFDPATIFGSNTLADNGGPVQTIALATGSPAINTGDDTAAPETDARGYGRNGTSDIGAFEYNGINPDEEPPTDLCPNIPGSQTTIPRGTHLSKGRCVSNSSGGGGSSSGAGAQYIAPKVTPPPATNPADCLPTYKFSPSTGKPCGTGVNSPTTSTTPTLPACTILSTLKQGMKGTEVKCLQTILKINADGVFGPHTKAAVIAFQKAHGLTPDGIVGPKTKSALGF